jgi:aromatic ring-opening dioxygenase LigB subunit
LLVWACIAPHGGELIPALANGTLGRMSKTRTGMEELGRRCLESRPDTVVVYTPHGVAIEDAITISAAERAQGTLDGENGERVEAEFDVDVELAAEIAGRAAQAGIPVVPIAHVESEDSKLFFSLDWGAFVPLWFLGAGWKARPRIVIVCPSRSLSRRQLMEFGRATAESAEASGKRVALVCSADQGHGHAEDGPYGFAPISASYDRAYCQAVCQNGLSRLLHWRDDWIDAALTDSYWQTLMLHGACRHTPMTAELISYEAPTYFGMAVAEFRPVGP